MTTAAAGLTRSGRGLARSRLLAALLAVSVVLNLCFVAGAVWTRLNAPPAMTASERFRRLAQTLDLSPSQKVAFDTYVSSMLDRGDSMRRAIDPLMNETLSEIAKPEPDQAKVMQLIDEANTRRHEFQHDAVASTIALLATLNPDQRAKFIADERARRAALRRRHIEEAH